jgi:steroid 5-alpha reductase family enzyme
VSLGKGEMGSEKMKYIIGCLSLLIWIGLIYLTILTERSLYSHYHDEIILVLLLLFMWGVMTIIERIYEIIKKFIKWNSKVRRNK